MGEDLRSLAHHIWSEMSIFSMHSGRGVVQQGAEWCSGAAE